MFDKRVSVKFIVEYNIEIIYFDFEPSFIFKDIASALNLLKEHIDYYILNKLLRQLWKMSLLEVTVESYSILKIGAEELIFLIMKSLITRLLCSINIVSFLFLLFW
jgi:hypothetical protein